MLKVGSCVNFLFMNNGDIEPVYQYNYRLNAGHFVSFGKINENTDCLTGLLDLRFFWFFVFKDTPEL